MADSDSTTAARAFVERWLGSGAAERANYALFLSELCDLIEVPRPEPATADTGANAYVFERAVAFADGDGRSTTRFIDLYKRGCFVLEAKQGSEAAATLGEPALSQEMRAVRAGLKRGTALRGTAAWDAAMLRAKGQADQYIRALPAAEGRPPFLIVVDVGHSIELFSEFTCTGGTYTPFPAAGSHRLRLAELENPSVRDRLRRVWTDPLSLDPSRRSARVTREIAISLAKLARALEAAGHDPHAVAAFLMRCLFTMFAEDVWLLPKDSFRNLLDSLRDTPEHAVPMLEELWQRMNTGGFSTSLRLPVLHFNGGLFEQATALPLSRDQLLLLIDAAGSDWRDVEPAIFGTLLERALDPLERHKLGSHFTPRAYVERLVLRTVMEPLRADWEATQAAAVTLANSGDLPKAAAEVRHFHRRLCELRILDPACGTANFLYVSFDHLKRLEQEVFDTLDRLGDAQRPLEMAGQTVFPNQFLGLEVNPRAAAIAELVLWIGCLQWHYRTHGSVRPPEPVIRNFHNIEGRDAVLEWDHTEPVLGPDGQPLTRWDGRTTRPHPVTGLEVPDETARVPVLRYLNPRPAAWPQADFIVGNPPFVGNKRMRDALGGGYVEALRAAHDEVPGSADFVMFWWNRAAALVRAGAVRRFGLVTTNSLSQTFNRRVVERHLAATPGLSLLFAIPDHPWVDAADGAAVRIAMTVGGPGQGLTGTLAAVTAEDTGSGESYEVTLAETRGVIHADLTTGAAAAEAVPLQANSGISSRGVIPHGAGFIVNPDEAAQLGLGRLPGLEERIRPYRNGRDLTDRPRGVLVIDLFGLTAEEVRERYPEVYQWLLERVKPERDQNNRKARRENWQIFAENQPRMRQSIDGLPRDIATVQTAKHRFFLFLDADILPDDKLIAIASDDAWILGVLSSRVHVSWSLATGATLEDRPVYNKTACFDAFPFPAATEAQRGRIRELGERLDAHRKARQALYPELTLTGMYNVLAALRAGAALTAKEKAIHEQGLVTVLRELHDDLDRAVLDAYGWPHDLADQALLQRLVDLNAARAAEESAGLIRWLRPEYQNPGGGTARTGDLGLNLAATPAAGTLAAGRRPWPKSLPERAQALREILTAAATPLSPADLASRFSRANPADLAELLETLVLLGHVRRLDDGRCDAVR